MPQYNIEVELPADYDAGLIRSRVSKALGNEVSHEAAASYLESTANLVGNTAAVESTTTTWVNLRTPQGPVVFGRGSRTETKPRATPTATDRGPSQAPSGARAGAPTLRGAARRRLASEAPTLRTLGSVIEVVGWIGVVSALILGVIIAQQETTVLTTSAFGGTDVETQRTVTEGLTVGLVGAFSSLITATLGRVVRVFADHVLVQANND